MMNLADALRDVRRLFLDTAPAIYFLERHPNYCLRMEAFFRIRRERMIEIVTSPITLAECLVHPTKHSMAERVEEYRRLILRGAGTEFHKIGVEAAERAVYARAVYSISLMDALQVGVAISTNCQAFLTNDRRLLRIAEIPILLLEDLEV
jgi:predicted nucleic acid-binding protein